MIITVEGNWQCNICDEQVRPPFLRWQGGCNAINICAGCCRKIKKGFSADLIHMSAIAELREIYPDATLVREGE